MPKPSSTNAEHLLQPDGYQLVSGKLMKNGSPLTIHLIGPTTTNAGPEFVASQLTQAGFDVQLKDEDYTAFVHDLIKANFDVAIVPSAVDFPWPTDAIVFFHGPAIGHGGINLFGINDPTLEADVSAAVADSGGDRCQLWGKVQHRLLDQSDLLPLASQSTDWYGHNINFVPGTVITDPLLLS
jgi:ABC-type transport system substrate-binding protein